jgi:hypothetical protein
MNRFAILLAGALTLAGTAVAQESLPREKVRGYAISQEGRSFALAQGTVMFQDDRIPVNDISFFSAEVAAAGEVVTAAPYTARAITETTQVLGDGNRIVNKSSAFVARDSQGRTRREVTLSRIGPLQMESPKMVFINDPTTHTQYILSPEQSTKVIRNEAGWGSGPTIVDLHGANGHDMRAHIIARHSGAKEEKSSESPEQVTEDVKQLKHENLGTQTIEGVSAEGKRETITIPAGVIGNERPIEIVSETWFSPELHTMVMRKHSDPRVGETVFRLTDIKRNEPDASLFQPPAGTKIKVEPLIELKTREVTPRD